MERRLDRLAICTSRMCRGRARLLALLSLGLVALVALTAFPAFASAATQTLTIKKEGTGTGTVTSSPAGINCGATCSAPFNEGTTIVLKGVPGTNTAEVDWSGCPQETLEKECIISKMGSKPITVTAIFNLLERPLKVTNEGTGSGMVTSSPPGINCATGTTCKVSFVKGTTVTLTGSSDPGTEPVSWTGCDSVNGENKCVVTMNISKSVTAIFDLPSFSLTVSKKGTGSGKVTSSPAGINCGSTCSTKFTEKTTVTLTGTPDPGTEPVSWTGCDSVNGENKCIATMSSAKSVTATFTAIPKYALTVKKTGSGSGTVISSPSGINCGLECTREFLEGTKVTLTGTSGIHTEPVVWTGCDSVNGENKCIATMSSAKSVTATFDLEPQWVEYLISVVKSGTGQGTVTSSPAGIDCGSDCSEKYLYKTSFTLTATAAEGSVFDHWSGITCAVAGPCEVTATSTKTIKAVFVAVGSRLLSVSKVGSGEGKVTSKPTGIDCGTVCSVELSASTKVVLTATPAGGSTFAGWSGACSGTGVCKVQMNEARNVIATFNKLPPGASTLIVFGRIKVKAQKARTRVLCNGESRCEGTIKLLLKVKNGEGLTKRYVVATVPYNLASGASATLEAKLSRKAQRLLGRSGHLTLKATGTPLEYRAVTLSQWLQESHK